MSTTASASQRDFDIGELYTGTYLKADDLQGKTYAATIAAVERVEIPEQDGSVRPKAAVAFQGWPAKLLLNKTNFEAIAAVYGRKSLGWVGKPLELFPDSTKFGGRTVPCVRVRVPRPAAPAAAVPGASAPVAPSTAGPAAATAEPTPGAPELTDDIPY